MQKLFSLLMMLFVVAVSAMAKGDKIPNYDITGAGSGNEGKILVKVYVYEKSPSDNTIKRCAVHGIVFRGCTGNNSGANQPAMTSLDTEATHATFCEEFFAEEGPCQSFASIVAGSYDRVKTSKGYKIGAIVEIDKTALRKHLEKAGMVRSLSSGF